MLGSQKVAVVTGGAQSIGRAIVEELLADGYAVSVLDADAEANLEMRARYADRTDVCFVDGDVGDEAAVTAFARETRDRLGAVTALVNNAAIANPNNARITELSLADWQRVICTNLDSIFLCCKHFVPNFVAEGGAIVNLASVRALQSQVHGEAYAASKGGVIALSHALAMSLGPAIRVNSVSPGWIDTYEWRKASQRQPSPLTTKDHAQHPVGRAGKPEDVAKLVAFLLSPAAGFISGQNYVVDGGIGKKMIYVE